MIREDQGNDVLCTKEILVPVSVNDYKYALNITLQHNSSNILYCTI